MIASDPDVSLNPKLTPLTGKISTAAGKLKLLTEGLQTYIAIENEKHHTEVDLHEVIQAAKAQAIQQNNFEDFELEAERMPAIEGYPKQLQLMLFHLIDNAIKFRSMSRRLTVNISHVILEQNVYRVSKEHYRYRDHLRIIFKDNGIGFSPEYIEYVFKLLKKLDSASSGLGIGLPLVKRIAQNHSGDIRVTSTPDAGTTFEIELPLKVS
jgi:phosphoserine phosphatase RsbU/P